MHRALAAALAAAVVTGCQTTTTSTTAPSIAPGDLTGLSPGALTGLLGDPELRRPEGPAEVWQYRTDRCVVDVFLLAEGSADARVAYAEARSRSDGPADAASCLSQIARS